MSPDPGEVIGDSSMDRHRCVGSPRECLQHYAWSVPEPSRAGNDRRNTYAAIDSFSSRLRLAI